MNQSSSPDSTPQQPSPHQNLQQNVENSTVGGGIQDIQGDNSIQLQGFGNQVITVNVCDKLNVSSLFEEATAGFQLTQQEYRNRKVLLNKVKKFWVEDVLDKSLHIKALLELGLEKHLDAVDSPFTGVQEIHQESRQILPSCTDAVQVFNQMGEGRTLLILGEAGAGKTITLLRLAQTLIACTERDLRQPIPVVFNLSSWVSKRQTIANWLVQELNSKYQVSKAIGKVWVKDQQLLLLLDGLDEVKTERREACIQALNQFIQTHGQTEIVVCSRIRDYKPLSAHLKLQGAICIQPLTSEQINQYLERAGTQLEAVKTLLQEDTALQELAKTPLTLSIITIAYQNILIDDLPKTSSVEEYSQHLFNTYIERMFMRRSANQKYSKAQAIHWLTWLARRMVQESQTIFLIEWMQPSLLSTNFQKKIYAIVSMLSIGFVFGIMSVPITNVISNIIVIELIIRLVLGIILSLLLGLVLVMGYFLLYFEELKIEEKIILPITKVDFSWLRARLITKNFIITFTRLIILWFANTLKFYLAFGFALCIGAGLQGKLIFLIQNLDVNAILLFLFNTLVSIILAGFCLVTIIGSLKSEKKVLASPNQGIKNSAKIAIFSTLFTAICLWLLRLGKCDLLVFMGIGLGVFMMTMYGGYACVKHFALRLVLYCSKYIPWNYTDFLDYATERIFLQKVGGGYMFIHRMLLEHFAQLELEQAKGSVK